MTMGVGTLTRRTSGDDSGASAVEYGLIVGAIAALVVVVVFALGGVVQDMFSESCATIAGQASPSADCTP
jgi:pilus assembly protein Flp/PilA